MLVKDLMTTRVVSVKPDAQVSDVADLLHKRSFTGIPVVNNDNVVVGLITEQELFSADSKLYLPMYIKLLKESHFVIGGHKMLPYVADQLTRTKAGDIMNQDIYFAKPDMEAHELAEVIARKNINPVPVTDQGNHLLGIISRTDLIQLLLPSHVTAEVHEHKPRPIDDELRYVHKDLSSRFAYVARARANIWITTAIVLFIVGFVAGIIYVADPNVFGAKTETSIGNP